MVPFYTKFPKLAETEMRVYTTFGDPYLPDGRYGFMESFCDDPNCDCHRVLINVISDNNPDKIWATINYGWKDKSFYANFLGYDNPSASDNELKGPYLDYLNPQSEHATKFLEIFVNLLKDQRYVERLERHYHLFKETFYKKNKATNIVDIKKKTKMRKKTKKKKKLAKAQRKKNR